MERKSAESGTGDANNLGQNMQQEVSFRKVRNPSIDDVLINEMLVSIFECLPAADRMRLELVSKKWNRMASK